MYDCKYLCVYMHACEIVNKQLQIIETFFMVVVAIGFAILIAIMSRGKQCKRTKTTNQTISTISQSHAKNVLFSFFLLFVFILLFTWFHFRFV